MPKIHRRFVVGQEYITKGASKFTRRLKFIARMKIDGQEHLGNLCTT
ncbi:MAG TPA: hypothetical protein VGQ65_18490 [Thermoanaerobaculia bacterium]|jgi:hypothetical protein|nr:hypothetical protein [Thermoanaerobaculia bacterium]